MPTIDQELKTAQRRMGELEQIKVRFPDAQFDTETGTWFSPSLRVRDCDSFRVEANDRVRPALSFGGTYLDHVRTWSILPLLNLVSKKLDLPALLASEEGSRLGW